MSRFLIGLVAALWVVLAATPARADQQWVWPVAPAPGHAAPVVLSGFDPPAKRWDPGRRGVLLAAPPGAVVRSAGAGTVVYAGQLFGRGVVAVSHGELRTTYLPVSPTVHKGDRVAAGAPIGLLEQPDDPSEPSGLHWGLVTGHGHDASYLDPLTLLGAGTVRLLPIWPGPRSAAGSDLAPGPDSALGPGPAPGAIATVSPHDLPPAPTWTAAQPAPPPGSRPDSGADSRADSGAESGADSRADSRADSGADSRADSGADSRVGSGFGSRAASRGGSEAGSGAAPQTGSAARVLTAPWVLGAAGASAAALPIAAAVGSRRRSTVRRSTVRRDAVRRDAARRDVGRRGGGRR